MVIGIAGGTCSGKTSIANILARLINAKIVSLDNYFKDPKTFPILLGHPDYDRIEAINWKAAIEDIKAAKDDVIVEGFLVLASEAIRKLLDISFFIDSDEDTLIARRLIKEPDTIEGYINKLVRERHRNLVVPSKRNADVILDGKLSISKLADEVKRYIESSHKAPGL